LEASQHFLFYRVGLSAPRPTTIPEDQASAFISPRDRAATHFSCLLRHAWITVGLFLFPGHHTGITKLLLIIYRCTLLLVSEIFFFSWHLSDIPFSSPHQNS
jgi:hypothetical protein